MCLLPGLSEEQIIHILEQAGKVNNFRLVHDKEHGRPKGFGFAEFADADAAASAVRNINGYEVMNRTLRVDWSNNQGGSSNDESQSNNQQQAQGPSIPMPSAQPIALPQLPEGTDLPPGLSADDAISQTLAAIPPQQLLDALGQIKDLVNRDPNQAEMLFSQKPQLSYAIFQALLLFGLVDTSIVQSVLLDASSGPPPPQMQQAMQPSVQQPMQAPFQQPFQPPFQPPVVQGFPPHLQQPPAAATPPIQTQFQSSGPMQGMGPELKAMVLNMSDQQIDELEPQARVQLKELRYKLRTGQA